MFMETVNEESIINLLKENGIKAAEEYFPNNTPMPYAVILTPSATIDGSDDMEIRFTRQTYRVELYTMSKKDPVRKKFKRIFSEIVAPLIDGTITYDESSFGKGVCYMTACEFETYEQYYDEEEEEEITNG